MINQQFVSDSQGHSVVDYLGRHSSDTEIFKMTRLSGPMEDRVKQQKKGLHEELNDKQGV